MRVCLAFCLFAACRSPAPAPAPVRAPAVDEIALSSRATEIVLPQTSAGGPQINGLAFDEMTRSLVVTSAVGKLLAIDPATSRVIRSQSVPSKPNGHLGSFGPSSIAAAGDVFYIANTADNTVCAHARADLARVGCASTSSTPRALTVVGTNELWVTTPYDAKIRVFDITNPRELREVTTIALPSWTPTGHALDPRGRYFVSTGRDEITVVDVAARTQLKPWRVACGDNGVRDVDYDAVHDRLIVACQKRVLVLDSRGRALSSLVLDGVGQVTYSEARRELYIPLVAKYRLVIARVGEDGSLTVVRMHHTPSADEAPVVAIDGTAFTRGWDLDRIFVTRP